jgi:hypothetical protein
MARRDARSLSPVERYTVPRPPEEGIEYVGLATESGFVLASDGTGGDPEDERPGTGAQAGSSAQADLLAPCSALTERVR